MSIVVDRATRVPLAVQLADALRAAAAAGALRVGDRLPSTRAMAVELGLSRTVTAAAYDQLLAEGWLAGRRGSGTYVTASPPSRVTGSTRIAAPPVRVATSSGAAASPVRDAVGLGAAPSVDREAVLLGAAASLVPAPSAARTAAEPDSHARRARLARTQSPTRGDVGPDSRGEGVDLRAGTPCVEVLDGAAWRRAWRAAGDGGPDLEPEAVGMAGYRAAVVEHLLRHRGLPADPEAVLATTGSTSAIAEVARTLPAGARVAVEEPGYQRARWALEAAGLVVVPARIDDQGLVVDDLPSGLAAVYCTPAHQYPMGARLPADRRVALVERARAEGFVVLEDDYDGELRYDVAPLPLLAALGPDVVVHLGTASKLLTPTLGVGWLVAPASVRAAVLDLRERTGLRPGRAGQRVFTALAAHGDLARHLRRLRRELAARRAAVVAALAAAGIAARGDRAGAHVVAALPDADAERAVIAAAATRGVLLDGLARHFAGRPAAAGLVLGYAGPPRTELQRALSIVTAVLANASRPRYARDPHERGREAGESLSGGSRPGFESHEVDLRSGRPVPDPHWGAGTGTRHDPT